MQNLTIQAEAFIDPGAEITTRARFVLESGTVMTSSDMSSITMKIFNTQDLSTPIVIGGGGATSLAIATSVVSGILETGNNWTEDSDGYNFSHTYDTVAFLSAGLRYKMIYKITTASSGIMYLPVFLGIRNISY